MSKLSVSFIVYSSIEVNKWVEQIPTVHQVRPSCCPHCGAAGCPLGAPLGMVGHGLRERQVRGPITPMGKPTLISIKARRYRCRHCGKVTTVLPRGVIARRHYGAFAIALAFLMYGMEGQSLCKVRQAVAPAKTFEDGWPSVRRWAKAVASRRMFEATRPLSEHATTRKIAERVAGTILSFAPSGADARERLFTGLALAA